MLAWLLALPSAPAETRPAYGGRLDGGLLGEPVNIDPVTARSHAEITLVSLVFDTLYRLGPKSADGSLTAVPHVAAEAPQASDDGLVVRIPIRPGVQYHGGRTLFTKDVVRSLTRLAKSPAGWQIAPVRSVRADGQEVVIRLSRPTPELAVLLTAPATSITQRGEPPKQARNGRVAGSGPFRLVRIDRQKRRIRLLAAANHFAGRPYVDRIDLRWFERAEQEATDYEAGRAHMSLRGDVAFAGHQPAYRTRVVASPAILLAHVGFGKTEKNRAITQNRAFRRALSLALDRNSFRGVGTGEQVTPAVHPIPVALGGRPASATARRANIRAARATLASAARSVPALERSGDQRVELELLIDRTRPDDREIAEKVVAALFRLGVGARITAVSAADLRNRSQSGDCDLYIDRIVTPVPTSAAAIAAAFAAGDDDWPPIRWPLGPSIPRLEIGPLPDAFP